MKKKITLVVALALVLVVGVFGTLAYLTDSTSAVKNTFTVGKVDIDLDESDNLDFQLIPGNTLKKDPKVTVVAGSEACYLFVKVEASNNLNTFIQYAIDSTWTKGDGTNVPTDVWYRTVDATTAKTGVTYNVLASSTAYPDGYVTVKGTVTSTDMATLYKEDGTVDQDKLPTLTFTAYACQSANVASVKDAWDAVKPTT